MRRCPVIQQGNDVAHNTPGECLAHPLVLRGAWLRVDGWYRSGNLAPQPELSRWRLHPEAELRKLAAALRRGRWKPAVWPQVPYPKKGACLRHYVRPTVRDQVAFMAHMVLLGPLLDHRVENFAFGNRWHRPMVWDRRQHPPRWVQRPYPLLTNHIYLPYSRSHGLFRRVAHWTVARMTGATVDRMDYGGRVQHPEDYGNNSLPAWTRQNWWGTESPKEGSASWAALDLQLAFPSVYLHRLRNSLIETLELPIPPDLLPALLNGYPRSVLEALARREERLHVGQRLADALQQVVIKSGAIPRDAWRPTHAAPVLPPDKDGGLPTGLAISGILLNVALHSTDHSVLQFLRSQQAGSRGAIVRFADDMYVLAQSPHALLDLIEAVWRGLAGNKGAVLASPKTDSNLHLNLGKIRPVAMNTVVCQFLQDSHWEKCDDCDHLCPPREPGKRRMLGDWWNEVADSDDEKLVKLREAVKRETVRRNEVGPFVTTLVERLSEIGMDTLTERFGEGARDRLVRLHELARFDIDDEQVRSDTRRVFAVNRLVRAWLPQDGGSKALADIRNSVAQVLQATPWKFSLWRGVVRAAARRPIEQSCQKGEDEEARIWLSSQLQRIAHSPSTTNPISWMHLWPEECAGEKHHREKNPSWRTMHLSFHRTAFWHALADVLRELWRHHDQVNRPHADVGVRPHRWTVRAVPSGSHRHVAEFLGNFDQWVQELYPEEPDLGAMQWELEELVAAVLASISRADLADAWRCAERPGDSLVIPETSPLSQIPTTVRLLERFDRIKPRIGKVRNRKLNPCALEHVQLAHQDFKLGGILFPRDQRPRILGAGRNVRHAVMMSVALGCAENVSTELASQLIPNPRDRVEIFSKDPLALTEYSRARRILLGSGESLP